MTLNQFIDKYGLERINSATKYPSILTYHALGQKGGMTNELCEGKSFPSGEPVEITEKVDGTNSRMVFVGGDYLIGSREEFVFAKGDRIKNSVIINPVLAGLSDFLQHADVDAGGVIVIFGETYGHKIQEGSKVYCAGSQKQSYRVFDIVRWTLDEFEGLMETVPANALSLWRDAGNQPFVDTDALAVFCDKYNIARTPIIAVLDGREIPTGAPETLAWMEQMIPESKATIDTANAEANQKFGRPEGLVVRTKNRSFIRKLRFEDYRKGEKRGWR